MYALPFPHYILLVASGFLKYESESRSVVSNSYSPWNSPGQNTGDGSLSLFQGTFPTQGSNPGLAHCRQILYQLSHQGSPRVLERVAYLLQGIFPIQEIKLGSPAWQVDSLLAELPGKPSWSISLSYFGKKEKKSFHLTILPFLLHFPDKTIISPFSLWGTFFSLALISIPRPVPEPVLPRLSQQPVLWSVHPHGGSARCAHSCPRLLSVGLPQDAFLAICSPICLLSTSES